MTSTLFCLDFDETLSNTDRLRADLLEAIRGLGKEDLSTAFLEAYEATREEYGMPRIALILKTLSERYELSFEAHSELADIFHDFSYQDYIYPGAEQAVSHLKRFGKVVLFSDGDIFPQSEKIRATTINSMVDGVLILQGKINYFDDLAGYWPAEKYVFIDDKQKVLDAAKDYFGERATTVHVKQGRYVDTTQESTADISVAVIGEVARLSF